MELKRLLKCSIMFVFLYISLYSFVFSATGSYTEDFSDENYKDNSATTANWDTTNQQGILLREPGFAETTGVINWGAELKP